MSSIARRKPYDRQLWNARILTRDEERALGHAIRSGTEAEATAARATLAACNLAWCRVVASKVAARRFADSEDCFGAAQLGLLNAIEKFDPDRGLKFLTFAHREILNAIQIHSLPYRTAATIPIRVVKRDAKVGPDQAAAAAVWDNTVGLDDPYGEHGGRIGDVLPSDSSDDVEAEDESSFASETVRRALAKLTDRHRLVVSRLYGIDADRLSRAQIGMMLGVSRERVRQIGESALAWLRDIIEADRATG